MTRMITEIRENMMVSVDVENDLYTVSAYIDGKLVNSLTTGDKSEAQAVYSETVYAMYK